MKKIRVLWFIVISVSVAVPVILNAQSISKTDSNTAKIEKNNLYAIQFYLVNGLSVAGKKQISDETSLRLHLDFSADLTSSDTDRKWTSKTLYDTSVSNYDFDNNRNSQSINASIQYLYYPYKSRFVDFYIGGGPQLGYSRSFSKDDSKYEQPNSLSQYTYENSHNSYNFGILFLSGCETKITNYISLFAEYKISVNHIWYNSESEDKEFNQDGSLENTYIYEYNTTSWTFYLNNIKLGLSINF